MARKLGRPVGFWGLTLVVGILATAALLMNRTASPPDLEIPRGARMAGRRPAPPPSAKVRRSTPEEKTAEAKPAPETQSVRRVPHDAVPTASGNAAKSTAPAPMVAPNLIRVCLTPDGCESISIAIRGRYRLETTNGKPLDQAEGLAAGPWSVTEQGLKIGERRFPGDGFRVIPDQSPAIHVDRTLYRGELLVERLPGRKLRVINVLPLEEYLASVVDSEMPAAFPPAAREAQAVVARTFAAHRRQTQGRNASFDLYATTRSQKYLGVEYLDDQGQRKAGESVSSREIVAATAHLVCCQNGRLCCCHYSAVCGGMTTDGTKLFEDAGSIHPPVVCEWCKEATAYRWHQHLTPEALLQAVNAVAPSGKLTAITGIRQLRGPGGGTPSEFELSDGTRVVKVTGLQLRERFPQQLLSPHFSMKLKNQAVDVEGRGRGHGVGLCQWGARGQALEGLEFRDILAYYYPGTTLLTLDQVQP